MELSQLLSKVFSVPERDIGYSGLKDKFAVTSQWFSVPVVESVAEDTLESQLLQRRERDFDLRVKACARHPKKLRRGWHAGNRFAILVREVSDTDAVIERFEQLVQSGCPNYFGPQRFGRDGANLNRLYLPPASGGRRRSRARRTQRNMLLSSARAVIFNAILSCRIDAENWSQVLPGEAIMLNGSNSFFFAANDERAGIVQRLAQHDVHPSGALWGVGSKPRARTAGEF